jgi:asparagine synthase (glutamine-hydrolysing)
LSGDGADEFLGGYPTYRATALAARLGPWIPSRLAQAVGRAVWGGTPGAEGRLPVAEILGRLVTALPEGERAHVLWRRLGPPAALAALAGPALRATNGADVLAVYRSAMTGGTGAVDRAMLADQRYYLPGDLLRKTDAMSMAVGLEVRVPFLDRRMMDLAGRIDARLLTGLMGPGKRVARALAKARGAPEPLVRASKRGFNVPVARLLRGALAPMAERVLSRDADRFAPLLDPLGVRRLWTEHRERRFNHGYLLWALLVFGIWQDTLPAAEPT